MSTRPGSPAARVPPDRIELLLCAAARREDLARGVEGLLLGLAAGVLTAAVAVLAGADPEGGGALAACALVGLGCAGAWWRARRASGPQLVRRIDRTTLGDGALVTAFECARRPERNPLEAALVENAGRAVDPRAARRAVAPPAAGLVAAPLVAAALLAFVLDARPAPGREGPAAAALRAVAVALGWPAAAGPGAPVPGAALDPELLGLLERARGLAARPARAADLERALAELERELERRAADEGGERGAELARAADQVRAARADPRIGAADRAGLSGAVEGAPGGGAGGTPPGPGLAGGPAASTMAGPQAGAGGPGDPAREPGVVGAGAWDAQYDGLVAAWVRRAAAADARADARDRSSE